MHLQNGANCFHPASCRCSLSPTRAPSHSPGSQEGLQRGAGAGAGSLRGKAGCSRHRSRRNPAFPLHVQPRASVTPPRSRLVLARREQPAAEIMGGTSRLGPEECRFLDVSSRRASPRGSSRPGVGERDKCLMCVYSPLREWVAALWRSLFCN